MTKKFFVSQLELLQTSEPVECNTNNSWGFGGGIYRLYTVGDFKIKLGKACYRHAKDSAFITVTIHGKRIIDATPRSTVFEKIILLLQEG